MLGGVRCPSAMSDWTSWRSVGLVRSFAVWARRSEASQVSCLFGARLTVWVCSSVEESNSWGWSEPEGYDYSVCFMIEDPRVR